MAKDKKKSESKKAKLEEKKKKQEKKAEKKAKNKQAKLEGSDAEDVDLDAVLEEYKRQQEQFHKVTETVVDGPPRARANATILANPSKSSELLLFGGEYFNGSVATFFNDLVVYNIDRDEWRVVTSPNAPLPRSGHAWTRGGNQANAVYLFGGEFSSPKQGTFYHYNDFWKLDPTTREWTRLEPKGKTPPARSGHRMTYFKQYIILFGGFQDTAHQTKYLNDLWIYDTTNFVWHSPVLPPAQPKPDARSSFTLLPHDQGAVLYGGYSRVKPNAGGSQQSNQGGKKGNQQQQHALSRTSLRPMIHTDCFFLRITPPGPEAPSGTPPTVRWERRKKPANAPNPPRAGATMAFHKGRGILFGGVHDVQESEEAIESEFFNDLFAWNVERNRFMQVGLRKPRAKPAGGGGGGSDRVVGGRKARAKENEEELLRQLAALRAGAGIEDDADGMEVDFGGKKEEEKEEKKQVREMPVSMEFPHPRFNAQLAVQEDVLYIYGGTFEKGDREYTFDDLYAIDLVKLDGCKEIFNRPVDDWVESEDEGDDDEDDDEEEDDEDEEMVDADGDVEMADEEPKKQLYTPSKRKKKQEQQQQDEQKAEEAAPAPAEEEEEPESAAAAPVDDGLPHPRPFESRRDFFQRTSNEWQEILLADLRKQGVAVEGLTVKELKAKAFELSEKKWWDCREEITLLEEEQEAAGIGEVVSLADVGGHGHGGPGGGGLRRR